MSYNKTTWQTGDIVTAEKLNNIENGIENVESLPSVTAEDDGDVLTVVSGAWAKATPSGGVFVVHDEYDGESGTDTLDKTWKEIHDALASGKFVPIVFINEEYNSAKQAYIYGAGVDGAGGDGDYEVMVYDISNNAYASFYADTENGYPSYSEDNGETEH